MRNILKHLDALRIRSEWPKASEKPLVRIVVRDECKGSFSFPGKADLMSFAESLNV